MKIMYGVASLLVLLLGLALVQSFPQERDVESIEKTDSAEDDAAPTGTGFLDFPNVYGLFPNFDLVSRIRGMVTKVREQFGASFGNIDWSKGNTTSTTKVVDGHIVTVNETSYKDDDSDLVMHIKVIDVKPTESDNAESSESTSPQTSEAAESEGNEIPSKPEDEVAESFQYYGSNQEIPKEHQIETRDYIAPDYSINDLEYPVDEVDNSVDVFAKPAYDLGRDIYVNKLMSDRTMSQGMFEVPPDVEVFSTDDRHLYETFPVRSAPIRHWNEERFR